MQYICKNFMKLEIDVSKPSWRFCYCNSTMISKFRFFKAGFLAKSRAQSNTLSFQKASLSRVYTFIPSSKPMCLLRTLLTYFNPSRIVRHIHLFFFTLTGAYLYLLIFLNQCVHSLSVSTSARFCRVSGTTTSYVNSWSSVFLPFVPSVLYNWTFFIRNPA